MQIMECRYSTLERTLTGYDLTQIPLIASVDGYMYPPDYTDDPGIYYFIPSIAHGLGISISQAINIFFYALVGLGLIASAICFTSQLRTLTSRIAAIIGLACATFVTIKLYVDVYLVAHFAVFTIAPWFLLKTYTSWQRILMLAICGILIGYSNLTRAHAGTGILLFILSSLAFQPSSSRKDKWLGFVTLACFTFIPYVHFDRLMQHRDSYLLSENPSYRPFLGAHPKWHSIYIGLGFLNNPYGITYSDTVAADKVKAIDPSIAYCSSEYDAVLRDQCFQLLKCDPWFVIKNIAAKLLKMSVYLLSLYSLGFFLLSYVRFPMRQIWPVLLAIAFYCIPGVLTIPTPAYISGSVSMTVIFAIYTVCTAIDKKLLSRADSNINYKKA